MTEALKWDAADEEEPESKEGKVVAEAPMPVVEDRATQGGAKKKKRPPSAKDLYEMLFDDVEERHATDFGIDAKSEPYVSVLELFKVRLVADFEDAVKYTNLGRAAEDGTLASDPEEDKLMTEYKDGAKLA